MQEMKRIEGRVFFSVALPIYVLAPLALFTPLPFGLFIPVLIAFYTGYAIHWALRPAAQKIKDLEEKSK